MGNSTACPGKPHDVCSDSKLHTQNLHQLPHTACIPGPGPAGESEDQTSSRSLPASVIHWSPRRLTAEGAVCQHCNTAASSPSRVTSWHSASKSSIRGFLITEKAPTRAFSWLKAATTAFTFKTLLRHYAKRALIPRSLNMKLGLRRKGHKGRAVWLAYCLIASW